MGSTVDRSNRQLTHGKYASTSPAFSPDGGQLAFTSARGEEAKSQVWLLSFQGGEARQLTTAKSGVNAFAWAPDGQRIAYTSSDTATAQEEADDKAKRDMQVLDTNFKYAHLYTIAIEPGPDRHRSVQRLTSGAFHVGSFDWSPDGKSLVFDHQVTPQVDHWPTTDISVVPARGGKIRSLHAGQGYDGKPVYSPDGKWIAFVSDGGAVRWASAMDVFLLSARGGKAKRLASTPNQDVGGIVGWSGSGGAVYVADNDHTVPRLFSVPVSGDPAAIVTPGSGSFNTFSISRDGGTLALVYQQPDKVGEVYVSPLDAFNMRQLSTVNAGYPDFTFGKTELIQWTSADGLEIEGLLTYPVNYRARRRYPLILYIHGGPSGGFTETFTAAMPYYTIQHLAQAGYAILRPNPRGSTGYGKEFRFANYNDWGVGDYQDLMAGVDRVIDMGVAHGGQLCVTGYSYGGYMTSWIVTQTSRFKAASIGAGVTNLTSFTGTADIPSFLPDYFGGEYWDRAEVFRQHSPMTHVKGVTTPTQVIHGEADIRVPMSQGLEFYTSLKRQGVATEMIVYPRARHRYLTWEPNHFVHFQNSILAWFDGQLGSRR